MKQKVILEIIKNLFIVLFLYASVTKLLDYHKFVIQIGQSPMLTDFAGIVAWFIPAVEILTCVLLIGERTRATGFFVSFTLMVAFTVYIIIITNFSEFVPCSCGGVLQKMGWTEHLIFNMVFVLLALAGVILQDNKVSNQQISGDDMDDDHGFRKNILR